MTNGTQFRHHPAVLSLSKDDSLRRIGWKKKNKAFYRQRATKRYSPEPQVVD